MTTDHQLRKKRKVKNKLKILIENIFMQINTLMLNFMN